MKFKARSPKSSWFSRLFSRRKNRRVRPVVSQEQPIFKKPRASKSLVAKMGYLLKKNTTAFLQLFMVFASVFIIGALGYVGYRYVILNKRFALKEIRIIANTHHVPEQTIITQSELKLGTSLFLLNLEQARAKLLEQHWLKEVNLYRELPQTVTIEVQEYQPMAVCELGHNYLVDERGIIFKRATDEEIEKLPMISGIRREEFFAQFNRSQKTLMNALAAITTWRQVLPTVLVKKIDVSHPARFALEVGEPVVNIYVPTAEANLMTWQQLEVVWSELKRTGKQPKSIYLRFNKKAPNDITVGY